MPKQLLQFFFMLFLLHVTSCFSTSNAQVLVNIPEKYKYIICTKDSEAIAYRVKGYSGLFTRISSYNSTLKKSFRLSYATKDIKSRFFFIPFRQFKDASKLVIKINPKNDLAFIEIKVRNSKDEFEEIDKDIGINTDMANELFGVGWDSLKTYSQLTPDDFELLIDKKNKKAEKNTMDYYKSLIKDEYHCNKNPMKYDTLYNVKNTLRLQNKLDNKEASFNKERYKKIDGLGREAKDFKDLIDTLSNDSSKIKAQLKSKTNKGSYLEKNRDVLNKKLEHVSSLLSEQRRNYNEKDDEINKLRKEIKNKKQDNHDEIRNYANLYSDKKFSQYYKDYTNNSVKDFETNPIEFIEAIIKGYDIYRKNIGGDKSSDVFFVTYNLNKLSIENDRNKYSTILFMKTLFCWNEYFKQNNSKENLDNFKIYVEALRAKIETTNYQDILTSEEEKFWNKYIGNDFILEAYRLIDIKDNKDNGEKIVAKAETQCNNNEWAAAANNYLMAMRYCCPNIEYYRKANFLLDTLEKYYIWQIEQGNELFEKATNDSNASVRLLSCINAKQRFSEALLIGNPDMEYPIEKIQDCNNLLSQINNKLKLRGTRYQNVNDLFESILVEFAKKPIYENTFQLSLSDIKENVKLSSKNEFVFNITYGVPIKDSLKLIYGRTFIPGKYKDENHVATINLLNESIERLFKYLGDDIYIDSTTISIIGQADGIKYKNPLKIERNDEAFISRIDNEMSEQFINQKKVPSKSFNQLKAESDVNPALAMLRASYLKNELANNKNLKSVRYNLITNWDTLNKGPEHRYVAMQLSLKLKPSEIDTTIKPDYFPLMLSCDYIENKSPDPCETLTNMANGKFYAIIVGIDTSSSGDKNIPILHECEIYAEELKEELIKEYGYEPENVKLLVGADATKDNILKYLNSFTDSLKPNDNILFYFSGHGKMEQENKLGYTILNFWHKLKFWKPVAQRVIKPTYTYYLVTRQEDKEEFNKKDAISRKELVEDYVKDKWLIKAHSSAVIVDACLSNQLQPYTKSLQDTIFDYQAYLNKNSSELLLKIYTSGGHGILTGAEDDIDERDEYNFTKDIVSILKSSTDCGIHLPYLYKLLHDTKHQPQCKSWDENPPNFIFLRR